MSTPMSCPFDELAASRYQTGEMGHPERSHFESHLASCEACARRVRRQRRLNDLLAALPTYRAPARRAPLAYRSFARAAVVLATAAALVFWLRGGEDRLPQLVSEALAADAAAIESAVTAAHTGIPQPAANVDSAIPWLGFVTCSARIAPEVSGVYICALGGETPLARAGVRAGDVLVAINRSPVRSDTTMYERLMRHEIGDRVEATIERDGERRRVRVPLIPYRLGPRHPFDMEWSPALVASLDREEPPRRDLNRIFVPLPDTAATRLGVPPGLLVALEPDRSVGPETVLGHLLFLFGPGGVEPGDVIIELYGRPVTDRGDLMLRLFNEPRLAFDLVVHRDGVERALHFRRPSDGAAPRAELP